MAKARLDLIQTYINDTVSDLLYYGRKESFNDPESLQMGEIEAAIKSGDLTIEQLGKWFAEAVEEAIELDT